MRTREKARLASIASIEKGVAAAEEQLERFDLLIEAAFDSLKRAAAARHREYRYRYHLPEASVQVRRASDELVSMLNGKLEAELSAKQAKQQLEDAKRNGGVGGFHSTPPSAS